MDLGLKCNPCCKELRNCDQPGSLVSRLVDEALNSPKVLSDVT
jgi:hypothetical protein